MILYKVGSLFDAEPGSALIHACNSQGVWSSGIAKPFKEKFPTAYAAYREFCTGDRTGEALLVRDGGFWVGCLITSFGYGPKVDPPDIILDHTRAALASLYWQWCADKPPVASNRFNSGLFRVEWSGTAKLIDEVWPNELTWSVYDPVPLD